MERTLKKIKKIVVLWCFLIYVVCLAAAMVVLFQNINIFTWIAIGYNVITVPYLISMVAGILLE